MRKNINKIIAFAIGVSVMSGSIIPAFAADSTTNASTTTTTASNAAGTTTANSNVLTLDDAVKAAISISNTLALDEQNIAYQDKENDITKKQDDVNDDKEQYSDDKEKYDDDKADTTLDKAKQQRDFDEDSLTQKVTDEYNSIVTQQMQIDMATKSLAAENMKLQNTKLEQSLGSETLIDTKTSELQIQKDQNSLTTAQNKLKDAEYSFKVLTGKDLTQYTVEKDVKFEPFKIDGDVDTYLDNVIESQLKYREELLKISKDYYNDKDYEKDNGITTDDMNAAETTAAAAKMPTMQADSNGDITPDDYNTYQTKLSEYNKDINAYTGVLSKRLTYLTTKLGNYQEDVTIANTKKQLKDQLRGYYTNLQTYEANVNYCKNEAELNNEKLSQAKLRYDLGMMTEADYQTQVASTLQAQIDLRNAIVAYNQNKEYIQKPWAASYSSLLY